LKELHPLATTAAMAGLCALQQGKYAEYHDLLYKVTDVQKGLSPEGLRDAAGKCGMDLAAYDSCMASPETARSVEEAIKEAQDLGITGIPSVYFNGKYLHKGPSAETLDKLYMQTMKAKQGNPASPVPSKL
jgi:protein-disulfide isomerase